MSQENVVQAEDLPPAYIEALRKRIGWICQLVRWLSVFYAGWIFWLIGWFWSDGERVRRAYAFKTKLTLTEPEFWQRAIGYGLNIIDWLLVVAAIYAVWQLMGEYLKGRIFQPGPSLWLRRIGTFGLAAMAVDILFRPILSGVMSLHMPQGARFIAIEFQPNDLLNIMFLLAFVALAHIFKSAAELADDHAQIV